MWTTENYIEIKFSTYINGGGRRKQKGRGGRKEKKDHFYNLLFPNFPQFYHLVQGGTREIQQMALIHFSKYGAE